MGSDPQSKRDPVKLGKEDRGISVPGQLVQFASQERIDVVIGDAKSLTCLSNKGIKIGE